MLVLDEILRWALVVLLAVGPLVALLERLNARDRRRDDLLGAVSRHTSGALREAVAVRARVGLLTGRGVVEIDLRECDRDELWRAAVRWRAGVPADVRLVVNGSVDRELVASVTFGMAPSGG